MMKRKLWSIDQFNAINLPEVVGPVSSRFGTPNDIRVLDMPIFIPDQGWGIPSILHQFVEAIQIAFVHEQQYGRFLLDHYVYITVDQKMVKKGNTGRRAGAHSDAYIERNGGQIDITEDSASEISNEDGEVSHTYILYDTLPTEFFDAHFPLVEDDCQSSLKTFDSIANTSKVVTYPNNTLLKLDPYVVHRSAVSEVDTYRTFVKISISRKQYARKGNTINDVFDYDWKFGERSVDKRNHPWR